jgi:ABC-type transport system involved in multi-copper enzyme maturation permease subunit
LESSAGLSWLRGAAWTVFALDLVILAQMAYALGTGAEGDPNAQAVLRGFTVMLASAMAGIAVVLIFSSWKRNIIGLWVSLICAAIPLLWVCASLLAPAQ